MISLPIFLLAFYTSENDLVANRLNLYFEHRILRISAVEYGEFSCYLMASVEVAAHHFL